MQQPYKRYVAEFINDEQLHRLQFALQLQQPLLVLCLHQLMQQCGRGGEGDR